MPIITTAIPTNVEPLMISLFKVAPSTSAITGVITLLNETVDAFKRRMSQKEHSIATIDDMIMVNKKPIIA